MIWTGIVILVCGLDDLKTSCSGYLVLGFDEARRLIVRWNVGRRGICSRWMWDEEWIFSKALEDW